VPCGKRDDARICIVDYPSGKTRIEPAAGPIRSITWFPDSRHLVVNDRGCMLAIDGVSGAAHTLLNTPEVLQQASMSPDGTKLIYATGTANYDIREISVDGKTVRPLVESSLQNTSPHWSPMDGSLVYIRNYALSSEIWTRSADGGRNTMLVKSNKPSLASPRFSPDGRQIAYSDGGSVFTILAAGGRPVAIFHEEPSVIFAVDWSPDGASIVFVEFINSQTRLLRVAASGGAPVVISGNASRNFHGIRWSPDGRWIACSAPDEVRLISPQGTDEHQLTDDVTTGDFSRDGKIYYVIRRDENRHWDLVGIDVASGREGAAVTLPIAGAMYIGGMALSADGKRLAIHANDLKYDLWMIEGFPRPARGMERLWRNWVTP
jgi:WD40 repeat protein